MAKNFWIFVSENLTFGKGFAKNSHLKPLGFLSRLFYMITVINGDGNADLSHMLNPMNLDSLKASGIFLVRTAYTVQITTRKIG